MQKIDTSSDRQKTYYKMPALKQYTTEHAQKDNEQNLRERPEINRLGMSCQSL